MAINFPATPTLNQTYTYNGRTWTYNGVGWQATGASGLSVYTKTDFTATAAQTTFSVTYTVGFVDVYYNGSKLSSSEYTATNGTSVVLGTACAVNDIVETIAWTVSTTLNPALGVATATSLAIGGATIGSNALAVTGTTQLNSALTYGGVTLSNAVTGTGNMVLSASPTLTGTLTGAAANFSGVVTFAGSTQVGSAGALGVGAAATASSSFTVNCGITNKIEVMTAGTYNCISLNGVNSGINTMSGIFGGSTGDVGALYIEAPTSISGRIGSSIITTTNTSGLGIGKTPSSLLDMEQTQNTTSKMHFTNASTGTAGIAEMRLTNSTSNAQMFLTSTGYTPAFNYRADAMVIGSGGAGGVTLTTQAAQPIYFGINNVEVARFDTSGALLVGTTTTGGWNGIGKVVAQTGTAAREALVVYNSAINGSAASFRVDSTTSNLQTMFYGGSVVGTITTNGTTTAYNTSSDARLKTNVSDADPASALIDAIQVRQFDWKSDASHQRYGMVAQELLEVAPEAVHQPVNPEDMMGVDYSKLVPMMIKTIQELTTRLAALEAK
jgi:hypothetical protein